MDLTSKCNFSAMVVQGSNLVSAKQNMLTTLNTLLICCLTTSLGRKEYIFRLLSKKQQRYRIKCFSLMADFKFTYFTVTDVCSCAQNTLTKFVDPKTLDWSSFWSNLNFTSLINAVKRFFDNGG